MWFGTAGVRRERWVRTEAIPRIKDYVYNARLDSAALLVLQVLAVAPHDSALERLMPSFTVKAVLKSEPEEAQVYVAPFDDTTPWTLLGTTPTDTLLLPNFTSMGVRVEKAGYRTGVGLLGASSRTFFLDPVTAPDSDMVHVSGGTFKIFLVGLDGRYLGPVR